MREKFAREVCSKENRARGKTARERRIAAIGIEQRMCATANGRVEAPRRRRRTASRAAPTATHDEVDSRNHATTLTHVSVSTVRVRRRRKGGKNRSKTSLVERGTSLFIAERHAANRKWRTRERVIGKEEERQFHVATNKSVQRDSVVRRTGRGQRRGVERSKRRKNRDRVELETGVKRW